jgi:peptidoglycan LD-endopeptidase CwlK
MFKFGKSSEEQLKGVHQDLSRLCRRAIQITKVDFGIIQGLRTVTQQKENVAKGASQTMRSRHLTGHAIDFGVYVDGKYINGDTPQEYKLFEQVAEAFKVAALELRIAMVWGGDWKTLKDGGHIELDRRKYP